MNINNTQPGYIPTDSSIENNGNESNIDQLLSVEVISATQQSLSVALNPTNMIPSQTFPTSNIQQQTNLLNNHQQQFQRIGGEQQRIHREQQEQRQQRPRQYRDPEEHRYIGYMLRLLERDPDRFERELAEQEQKAYLRRRSPTFDELSDEIFDERQLEDYNLERMTPQERQEAWEQQNLNELQGNPPPPAPGLPLDNLEQYAVFLRDQLLQEQQMQIDHMEHNDHI